VDDDDDDDHHGPLVVVPTTLHHQVQTIHAISPTLIKMSSFYSL
jgi:hypothetical protein